MSRSLRVLFMFALAVLSQAGCDTPHSSGECTPTIPCPDGMTCTPDGVCVLVLPYDASIDARPIRDAGPDAQIDATNIVCGDGVCLGSETCFSCGIDCGECPFSCGDGVCQPGAEDCVVCPVDCGACPGDCGDGACDDDEDCLTCALDCGTCTGCDHGVCETGGPLDLDCDPCAPVVCDVDPFCCATAWDSVCVDEADSLCLAECSTSVCGDGTCNGGAGETCSTCELDCGPCTGCAHDVCELGEPLLPACFTCVADICDINPFCCMTEWDATCRLMVEPVCGITCGEGCGDGLCLSDEDCENCPTDCCQCPNFVCEPENGEDCATCPEDCDPCGGACGDGTCSSLETACTCELDCGDCTCAHDLCESGDVLAAGCDPCVDAICASDPFCCATAWDTICANEVETICGLDCGGGAVCGDSACSPGEDCTTCPGDCGPCMGCGDGSCDAFSSEDCASCELDCGPCAGGCGDGVCDVDEGPCTCEADCGDCACSHEICDSGEALASACDPCVDAICAVDPFCCTTSWDGICVNEVETVCGQDCTVGPACGDGVCSGFESCETCPLDCGECGFCGDGLCDVAESCVDCNLDCGPCSPECPDIVLMGSVNETDSGTTVGAGLDFGGATCGGGGASAPEVTYLYVAPTDGEYTIDTIGSGFDTLLYVRSGTDCGGTELACNDDFAGLGTLSQVTVDLVTGQQINIIVDGFSSNEGPYTLNITGPVPPACGDGMCTSDEDCLTCPTDCGPCPPGCGDGVCSTAESCETCPLDCGDCPIPCVDEAFSPDKALHHTLILLNISAKF